MKVLVLTCLIVGVILPRHTNAVIVFTGDVDVWNVGNGQKNGDFQVTENASFTGGTLELGLRATLRQVGNIVPVGSTYIVDTGIQPGTEGNPRTRWNFDYSVHYDGMISDLDSLTLSITSMNANMPTLGSFDLLNPVTRSMIDCHVIGCATNLPPAGMSSDAGSGSPTGLPEPDHYYQGSQNPVFGWFTPGFDSDLVGDYGFELTAARGASIATSSMTVSSVPEPSAFLCLGLCAVLGGAIRVWFRKK